jgi:hypothetical protein
METKLNLEIIESFNLPKKIWTPDWDDKGYEFTLPCGVIVTTYFVCNNTPTESDALEGLDGWLYITSKEELEKIIKMDASELFEYIAKNNKDFPIEKFKEEYEC